MRNLTRSRLALFALLLFALARGLAAQGNLGPSPYTEASLVAGSTAISPGSAIDVALRLELDPGWHAYWINPGDSGLPVKIEWTLPAGVTVGPLGFPPPKRVELAGIMSYAHEGDVWFPMRLALAPGFEGDALQLTAKAEWLVCEAVCLPAEADLALTIPVGAPAASEWADELAAAKKLLPVPAEGWTVSASLDGGDYLLSLRQPDGSSVSLDGAQVYLFDSKVLEHAAIQVFQAEGDAWAVRLTGSTFAEAPSSRLTGILVAPAGTTFADGAASVEIDAEVAGVEATASVANPGAGSPGGMGLWLALLFALVGGMLLNLMPCVFPILSIKILGFVDGQTSDRAKLRAHGLAFGAGVLVSFLALAGLLLALRAGGESLGWGFQMQSPWIVGGLALLMVGLGLNLLGVFEVGQRLATAGAQLDRASGLRGAFLSGVLATVVATPCTAPFMGAALGYALAQTAVVSLVIFAALGVGMALPYVLLSFFPAWTARLPRPGPWMESLKQMLAFPLFATAVWLVWVFGQQTGVDGAALLLFSALLLGFAAWFVGRWSSAGSAPRPRRIALAFAVLALAGSAFLFARASIQITSIAQETVGDWQPFTTAAVEAEAASGRPVFIDFTAAWCLTCQVNKKTTLHTAAVEAAFAENGVTRFRADWTNRDPEITAFLDRFGRSGVPLYVFYPGGGADPVLLPEVLTPQIVLDAISSSTRTRSGNIAR